MTNLEVLKPSEIQKDSRIIWCENNIASYLFGKPRFEINNNNELIIYGDIVICNDMEKLPIKINKVYGSVYIDNALQKQIGNFKSLKNMPDYIYGSFNISMNPNITTLKDGPIYVKGSYWCNGCGLTDLNGIPKKIEGGLLAFNNNIDNINSLCECHISGNICLDNNPIEYKEEYNAVLSQKYAYY